MAGVENILTNCFSIRVCPLRHSSAPDSLFRWTPKWTTVKGWTGGWTLTTSKVDTDHKKVDINHKKVDTNHKKVDTVH